MDPITIDMSSDESGVMGDFTAHLWQRYNEHQGHAAKWRARLMKLPIGDTHAMTRRVLLEGYEISCRKLQRDEREASKAWHARMGMLLPTPLRDSIQPQPIKG